MERRTDPHKWILSFILYNNLKLKPKPTAIQNGLWFFKLASVIGLAVGGFYLPHSFPMYWMYFCIGASILYIVIQVCRLGLSIDLQYFQIACTRLYTSLCPSVRLSVITSRFWASRAKRREKISVTAPSQLPYCPSTPARNRCCRVYGLSNGLRKDGCKN